tara:strand:- start:5090 stop:5263 length:174 start_codon:yes stop_codon:yes gene_type:complete
MSSSDFDRQGLDPFGIHWAQYFAMTNISLLIFLTALDKAVPNFHKILLQILSQFGVI